MCLEITDVEIIEFSYTRDDIKRNVAGDLIYNPGNELEENRSILRIRTDAGITGAYLGSCPEHVANYLIGEDALLREKHWSDLKRAFRATDGTAIGPIDVALWDIAGKYYGAPIHELIGTYQKRIPVYASTTAGDENGGLDSPEAYARFAEECKDMGYQAYKMHVWSHDERDIDRHVDTVHKVGERVGDSMELMLDAGSKYITFGDALKVGKACDAHNYYWYEDPYRDGGRSQHGHRKLRQLLETPLLMTEHVHGLEPHTDFMVNEATDFVRGDLYHGITGAIKVARSAEGLGLDIEYHGSGPAKLHCIAATRNTNYYELGLVHPEIHDPTLPVYADFSTALDIIDEEGMISVPSGPGLGVEYDWSFIEDHKVNSFSYN